MKKTTFFLVLHLSFLSILTVNLSAQNTSHPHLFFGQARVDALRNRANLDLTLNTMWRKFKRDRIDGLAMKLTVVTPFNQDAGRTYGNALTDLIIGYIITGDSRYVTRVKEIAMALADAPDWSQQLSIAHISIGFAFCWDLMNDKFSSSERTKIRNAVKSKSDNFVNVNQLSNHNWTPSAAEKRTQPPGRQRFSALSYFGLAPAAIVGVDLPKLIKSAADMAAQSKSGDLQENTSAHLGAILGVLALLGRDKVTLFSSPGIEHFGAWAEQLIAESTGKDGMGILPVDLEEAGNPAQYRDDRLFVYLKLAGDTSYDDKIAALQAAGHPTVEIELADIYELGGEFFRWEFATAVASMFLGINPYDQPNVESAKIMARSMVAEYHEKGALPAESPDLSGGNIETHFYSALKANDLKDAVTKFLAQGNTSDPPLPYVAIQAYVPATDDTAAALQKLRLAIRDILRCATTVGYGPRFLHSTGQLHKGDFGNGLFIQITGDMPQDAAIPDNLGDTASSMSFGVLKTAQALGDAKALVETGRKMIKFHIKGDVAAGIDKISDCLEL